MPDSLLRGCQVSRQRRFRQKTVLTAIKDKKSEIPFEKTDTVGGKAERRIFVFGYVTSGRISSFFPRRRQKSSKYGE